MMSLQKSLYHLFLVILLSFTGILHASNGLTSANFLKLHPYAPILGISDAATAYTGKLGSLYKNPAAVYGIEYDQISLSYMSWLADTYLGNAYFVTSLSNVKKQLFGGGISFFASPAFEIVNQSGEVTNGKIGKTDIMASLFYAQDFDPFVIAGSVKFYRAEYEQTNFAIDIGVIWSFHKMLQLGASLQNLGLPFFSLEGSSYWPPITVNIGLHMLVYEAEELKANAYVDMSGSIDEVFKFSFGAELLLYNILTIRAGYQLSETINQFSIGVGFEYIIDKTDISLNYTMLPLKIGFISHVITLEMGI